MTTATRRTFLQTLGAGVLVSVVAPPLFAQQQRPRGGGGLGGAGARTVSARIHIGNDGVITVMSGKVECGQGARAELTQAAAEELRVAVDQIQLIMADTALVPDDGMTAGSGTTPRTVPAVRQGAAAAREMLIDAGATRLSVPRSEVEVRDGKVIHAPSGRSVSYAELAGDDLTKAFSTTQPSNIVVTPVKQWQVMGTPAPR